jgi:hypothetical protein
MNSFDPNPEHSRSFYSYCALRAINAHACVKSNRMSAAYKSNAAFTRDFFRAMLLSGRLGSLSSYCVMSIL